MSRETGVDVGTDICESCGGRTMRTIHSSKRQGLDVGRCSKCGMVSVLNKPSPERLAELYAPTETYEQYVAAQRSTDEAKYTACLDRLVDLLPSPSAGNVVFDVGAGAGAFLALARTYGFGVSGNEISDVARRMCDERHGIPLTIGQLNEEGGADRYDAMTMWCVLAHVHDPSGFLADAYRLLKPGGILYLQTPRWCAIDAIGLATSRLSGGRLPHVIDRRVNAAHLRLFNASNLSATLTDVGFNVIQISPRCEFGLTTRSYLESMQVPRTLRRPLAWGLDGIVDRTAFLQNILVAFAKKPRTEACVGS